MRGKQKLTIWFLGLILGLACLTLYGSSGAAESTQGPFNLIGWDSGRYIQLNWDAAPEPMLGGYNIYRAVNAQDEWQKLNNQVFSSTSFVDHSAPRSGLIFYRVNLVDSAGHEFFSASVVQISRTAVIAELSESGFALSHDQNSIINDLQLLNTTTMSVAQIQTFLSAQGSVLATYSSGGKTAAQRIFDDCQTHGINPQVVLVTLQKEKGLIKSSTGNPNSLAMGWNTSDSTTSDFANQIYFGTRQFRLYYNNLNNYGWSVGQPHNVSDGVVTAASTATAGLYIYTPWIGSAVGIGGNYLFWDLWYKTFSFSEVQETPSAVADGFDFPVGATNGSGWLNNLNGLQFLDLFNYGGTCGFTFHPGHDFNKDGTSGDQDRFEPVYAVANGTVIKSAFFGTSTWGNVILIEHTLPDGTKVWSQYGHLEDRGVQDGAVVTRRQQIGRVGKGDGSLSAHLHFEIRKVNQSANAFPCGQSQAFVTDRYYNPIEYLNANRSLQVCNNNTATLLNRDGGPPIHPPSSLLKTSSSSTVYLIDPDNRKRAITSAGVLAQLYNQSTDARSSTNFSNWVITVSQAELDLYEQGGNLSAALPGNGRPFPDGKLISLNGQVSIITGGGKRRPFATENVFTGLGYKFCHVVNVSQSEYNSYPAGPPVDAMPLLTSSVNLSPSGPYSVGQNITGNFTIKNVGYESMTFSSLGLGGRFNSNVVHDMNFVSTTLAPGSSHFYSSNLTQLSNSGSYEFFAAYREPNDHWALSVPAAPGVVRRRQINVDGGRPSPPTANPATNISTTGFTANWNSSSNATGYRLDISTSNSFASFVNGFQNLDVGNVLSRNVTGLSPGITYFYRVRAYNSAGTSDNSATVSATTGVNPPAAPTTNPATNVSTSGFTANWSSSANVTGYRLDVSTSDSFASFVSGFQNLDVGNVLSRNVTGLAQGTTYFYRVRAYNSAGTSSNSGAITVTTSTQSFTITITASPSTAGNVTGGGTFAAGSTRTVIATANSGHTFANWTENGNVVSTAASYSFILNANRNLIANFVTTPVNGNASYDAFLKVPKCGQAGALCDSGALLNGRDSISGGQEPNQPNTINSSCPDNTAGSYHVDESVDRIRISTLDGSSFAPGKTVRIEVSVWAFAATQDFLDLFYAPDANNPNWIYITTLVPAGNGAQVLTTTFTLASGSGLQAVRANFLFQGSPTACSGGEGNFDDHDDLAFAVQNDPGSWQPHVLTSTAVTTNSWTINGRTFLYVKLNFPDVGFRVSNWGSPVRIGNDVSVDALVERFSGVSTQALSSTAQIYDLGFVPAGAYTFTFKNSGTTVKVSNFAVTLQPPPANPIDGIAGAREFVRWQYKDFLRREPDGPGWDHWTGEITMCTDPTRRFPGETESACIERKRANTSAAFFFSPEFQNTGYFVIRVYRGSLGRMPYFGGGLASDSEFTRDATTVAAGIVVNDALAPNVINANKQAFVSEFVTRSEFRAIYDSLNNTQFVDKLFQTTGVTPTSSARQSLIDGLNNGSETRTSVLFKVVDGTTTVAGGLLVFNTNYGKAFYDNLFNAAFVRMEYFGYLLRDPDPDGYNFWLDKLNHVGNWVDAQMVLAFITSPEYRARFGAP